MAAECDPRPGRPVRFELELEEVQAVLAIVGERVSITAERNTPLERAERKMDSALLAAETVL